MTEELEIELDPNGKIIGFELNKGELTAGIYSSGEVYCGTTGMGFENGIEIDPDIIELLAPYFDETDLSPEVKEQVLVDMREIYNACFPSM